MFGWFEIGLLLAAACLLVLRCLPWSRPYHPLLGGFCLLLLITALYPRTENGLGQYLFGQTEAGLRLPREVFGLVWWGVGAWLLKSLMDLALRRTFFPENDEPQARRLFADLATVAIYALAVIGIVGTVFNQPVSTFLATSGVLAVVLGLAFQNTLGDVLAGLAINIERPFGAGDWITLPEKTYGLEVVTGQVMQVNWRATRLRSWAHDLLVIPNSVAARAVVANHSRPVGPHRCVIKLTVDAGVAPRQVIAALQDAAYASPDIARGTAPLALACGITGSEMAYQLAFAVDNFAMMMAARSDMLSRIAEALPRQGIVIGPLATQVQIVPAGAVPNPTDRAAVQSGRTGS